MTSQGALFELAAEPMPARLLGYCASCQRGISRSADQVTGRTIRHDCDRFVILEPVQGTVTSGRCNADCMSARGPICSCSCGGRNHGIGWA